MANTNLTDNYIKSLKAPDGKRLEIFDQKVSGLVLRVSGQGRKTWVLRYRTENGHHPRFTIGTYPSLKLADARDEALKLLGQAKKGDDPATERRRSRVAMKSQDVRTFEDLIEAYWVACEKGHWKPRKKQKRERSIRDERAVYRRYLKSKLGSLFLAEIQRSVVKKLLRALMDTGIKAQTIQVQALIRQAFNFGIAEYEDLILFNPAMGFGVIGETKARTRTLNDGELHTFWNSILIPPMLPPNKKGGVRPVGLTRSMGIALQLNLLLLNRPNEIAGMRVDELNFDTNTWLIPGSRMKTGTDHLVPLPSKAIALIKEALALRPNQQSAFVFPSPRYHLEDKPFGTDSMRNAMLALIEAKGLKHATPHDLRRTGSTTLTQERVGVSPFIRSKILSHTTDTGGGASVSGKHYDVNEYVAEKRYALTKWQNLLLKIVGETSVTALRAGKSLDQRAAA